MDKNNKDLQQVIVPDRLMNRNIKPNPSSQVNNSLTDTTESQLRGTEIETDSIMYYSLEDLHTFIEKCYDPEKLRTQLSKAEKLKKEMVSTIHAMFVQWQIEPHRTETASGKIGDK